MNGGVELENLCFWCFRSRAWLTERTQKGPPFVNEKLGFLKRPLVHFSSDPFFFFFSMGWGWRIHCDEIRMRILSLCVPPFPILACRVLVKEINGLPELIAVKIFCENSAWGENILMDIAHLLLRDPCFVFEVTFVDKYPWKCNRTIAFLISSFGNVSGNLIWVSLWLSEGRERQTPKTST